MTAAVLAVDPGKTTGYWAYFAGALGEAAGGQLPQWDFIDLADELLFRRWEGVPITVVCESFTITQRSMTQRGERCWAIEQAGVLQQFSRQRGRLGWATSYVEQSPADAKGFATDAKLRRVGWWATGQEHCRDAARHALLHAVRRGHAAPADLLNDKGRDNGKGRG